MKLNVQRIFLLVNLLLYVPVAVLLWAGLSRKDYSANQKENCYRIGVSYMTMNNEFYKIVNEEILNRAEMEGDQVILRDPALDAKRQIEQIEEMLAMDVDVLVVTPVDGKRLSEVLNRAKGQGVYIVVVDTNLEDERLADCTITSDNYSAGCLVGQYFLKENQLGENPFGEKQDVNLLVMTHDSAKSGQDRVQGFLDVVEKSDRVHVVQRINCDGQLEIAMPKIEEVIRKGTAFDTVFCLNDLAAVGVVAALDEHELLERVKVYGIDASPDAKALIKEGMMSASSAQFPSRIGQTAADVIYRLLRGEEVEKEIFLPVELVTRENVEEYSISRWQ
ncbi:MAG: sugar ABC transporter substrate-binding protein [Lachnospiraceae bacterium]|jgi:ribose transport system substrate-binding protein|nr:sugar ABC transporter substrate-binding protein [Lachnospiraceae bacterium]